MNHVLSCSYRDGVGWASTTWTSHTVWDDIESDYYAAHKEVVQIFLLLNHLSVHNVIAAVGIFCVSQYNTKSRVTGCPAYAQV